MMLPRRQVTSLMLTYRHQLSPRAPIQHLQFRTFWEVRALIRFFPELLNFLLHHGGNAHWYVVSLLSPSPSPSSQSRPRVSSQLPKLTTPKCSTEEPVSLKSDMPPRYVASIHLTIEHHSNACVCQNFPEHQFPSIVGRPILRTEEQSGDIVVKDIMCGDEAAAARSMLQISYPVRILSREDLPQPFAGSTPQKSVG